MTSRTYSYTFTGAGTMTAPGGRFFFIKSASSPLTIVARGDASSVNQFDNVAAGFKFGPVEPAEAWRYLDLTSAAAQIVELIVSDSAEVDVANTVNVAGSVITSDELATGHNTPARVSVGTSSTSLIAANVARKAIAFQAPLANTAAVNVGTAGQVSASRGVELQPGATVSFGASGAAFVGWAVSGTQLVQPIEDI